MLFDHDEKTGGRVLFEVWGLIMYVVSLKEAFEKDGCSPEFAEMIVSMISDDYHVVFGSERFPEPDVGYKVWHWDSNFILSKKDAIKFVMQHGGN